MPALSDAANPPGFMLRNGTAADLPVINAVVDAAVLGWPLAERLKRLALPVLRYGALDLTDYRFLLAHVQGEVVGVAAWCGLPGREPGAAAHALLHGLYVDPGWQGQGVGGHLLETVVREAGVRGMSGVLVKAERVSAGFFAGRGLVALPPGDVPGESYPYRFWQACR